MTCIYVCRFSTGVIKVGRSNRPDERIKEHAERVACVNVGLDQSRIFRCEGNEVDAETALLQMCFRSATKVHGSEWFSGLDFETVCHWALAASTAIVVKSADAVMVDRLGGADGLG